MDDPLSTPAPTLSTEDAIIAAVSVFGIKADDARSLGSERDQAMMLFSGGEPQCVMKVSNLAQDPLLLDLESLAACHVASVDPSVPVAVPLKILGAEDMRGQWKHHDGKSYWIRCYPVMPGTQREYGDGPLSNGLLKAWAITSARCSKALRSFGHVAAFNKVTPWDAQRTLMMRPLLIYVPEERGLRSLCTDVMNFFESDVMPRLRLLRHQVVHGDFNMGNVLVQNEKISGVVDFGDMSFTSIATDIASMFCALGLSHVRVGGRIDGAPELLRMGRILLDGYQAITPLDEHEIAIIPDLWMARVCLEMVCFSWRTGTGLETQQRIDTWGPEQPLFEAQLRALWELGPKGRASGLLFASDFSGNAPGTVSDAPTAAMADRRNRSIGPGSEPLSYSDDPLWVSHASGCWITDTSGRKFLDCYNNVPCVGHAHPRVAVAIARQASKANVNMRYLHPLAITLAERLKSSLPADLDTVFFCNSGSEANDLAWRMATSVTKARGAMCTKHAYHGISEATIAFSPETAASCGHLPTHVERWAPPDAYRSTDLTDTAFRAALARLNSKGLNLAMVILDGVMQSDGIVQLEPEYVQKLVQLTHEAGGLWCADEVQGGHGRVGSHMWSFQKFGISPDFVTMGKPMGNGHPVACCITKRAIADQFVANEGVYFSTFGGNPVSCAAGHAVLDVLEDEAVLPRVLIAGDTLRQATRDAAAAAGLDCVGDVRGRGLATGIEIVTDGVTKDPNAELCSAIKNALKRRGVLVGTAGPHCNVLKVRPPLAFTAAEVPVFVDAFVGAVQDALAA